MTQGVLTFVSTVKPDRVGALRAFLASIEQDPARNAHVPFASIATLHFANLVLHEDAEFGARLIFESNFDGELEDYLQALYAAASSGLHEMYQACEGYAAGVGDKNALLAFLRAHVVLPSAYHIGNTGRSVQRILQENALRDTLETQADLLLASSRRQSAQSLYDSLQNFVRGRPDFAWVLEPAERQSSLERIMAGVKFALALALLLLLLPLWLPIVVLAIPVLRWKETHDVPYSQADQPENVSELLEREDRFDHVQNHFANIALVKPGIFRQTVLRVVLFGINLLARTFATKGKLSGIASIHFAHWALIDGGRRLLFLSNFDGSWENYLDDFVDKASRNLTAIWSNTVGFPRTSFLLFGGAADTQNFKAAARSRQTVTNVRYSAYPLLSVQAIDNNSSLREDFFQPGKESPEAWLGRL